MSVQQHSSTEGQMGEKTSSSLGEWRALFEAAIAFKRLKCWEWMLDSDLFGIQDPQTGEVGYCCVMGQLGEVFALNVYPGVKGFASYQQLRDFAQDEMSGKALGPCSVLATQNCVMASFEDRSELHQKDLQLIRSLGLKFRGKREWPMFRNYQPGYEPWFLTAPDVGLLTVALQQAIEVAKHIKENPLFLDPPKSEHENILVRTCLKGTWIDVWQPVPEYRAPSIVPIINDLQLAQLKKADFPRRGTWVTDCVMLPMPIHEGGRPYYPFGFPVLSSEGRALGIEMLHPEELESQLPEAFMKLVLRTKSFPQSLQVGSERAYALLQPIAQKLKFSLAHVESLPILDFFLQGMEEFLGR